MVSGGGLHFRRGSHALGSGGGAMSVILTCDKCGDPVIRHGVDALAAAVAANIKPSICKVRGCGGMYRVQGETRGIPPLLSALIHTHPVYLEDVRSYAELMGLRVHRECGGFRLVRDDDDGGVADVFPSCGVCRVVPLDKIVCFLRGYAYAKVAYCE